ncbi:hypothetical protein [Phytopseudomonas punonensis]|uniref:Uncharacterized protein n=1 Tax=Phytopseudomonas punonensis TaxID=1220495 RepID=A0A1M7IIW2_9GAMM|nr:hypothetical protein [Pseudomonas punonensis]SHM40714.1 hypothetical protein SAMN05216288_3550 [Pseudomonas punonensis]
MLIHNNWVGDVMFWIFLAALGALAFRVLYLFFTSGKRKRSSKRDAGESSGSGGTSGAMISNDSVYGDSCGGHGGGDCGGGGDGGGGSGD